MKLCPPLHLMLYLSLHLCTLCNTFVLPVTLECPPFRSSLDFLDPILTLPTHCNNSLGLLYCYTSSHLLPHLTPLHFCIYVDVDKICLHVSTFCCSRCICYPYFSVVGKIGSAVQVGFSTLLHTMLKPE